MDNAFGILSFHMLSPMKYPTLLLLIILFGCHSADDKTIEFLNDGLEGANQRIAILNDNYYSFAEVSILEDPNKNSVNKHLIDRIHDISDNVLLVIRNNKKLIEGNPLVEDTNKIKDYELIDAVESFVFLIDSIFSSDSIFQKQNDKLLKISKQNPDKFNKIKPELLENQILCTTNTALTFFYRKMETPKIHINKLKSVVIPKSKYLRYGENYEARLALLGYDTTCNIQVMVDNKSIPINEGKAIFIDTLSDEVKVISKNGILEFRTLYSDYSYNYPFMLSYQFVVK